MEHHRPHQRNRHGRGHHRHCEHCAQYAAPAKLAMEDQRRNRPEDERHDDREHREVERMTDRLNEALVRRQIYVVVEADEMGDRPDLPVERAHPDGEQPRKNDHRADHDERRNDEPAIVAAATRKKRRGRSRRASRAHGRRNAIAGMLKTSPAVRRRPRVSGYAFSLLSSTGWKSAVAFLSSAAGSAPLIMLVSAMPNTSRNSVTGSMLGSPGGAMAADASMHSTHSFGALKSLDFCAIASAELRTGAPAAACRMRVWFSLFDAHCR